MVYFDINLWTELWCCVRRQHKADAEENKTRQCLQNSLAKQSASSVSGSCRQTRLWHAEEDVKRLSEETYHLVSKRFDISLQEWEALETAKTSLEAETKQLMANLQDKEKVVILLRVFVSTMHNSNSDLAPPPHPPPAPLQTPDHPCTSRPHPVGACGGLEFLKNGLCSGLQCLEEKKPCESILFVRRWEFTSSQTK